MPNVNHLIIQRMNMKRLVPLALVLLVAACSRPEQSASGDPAGIAAIFASVKECAGYPVASNFDPHDLPDYETYDAHNCPWCRQGKKIDALVNSFGYSTL